MTLTEFTTLALGIASALVSIVLLLAIAVGFSLYRRLQQLFDRLDAVSRTGLETSQTVKAFVERMTEQAATFAASILTAKGVADAFKALQTALKPREQETRNKKGAPPWLMTEEKC